MWEENGGYYIIDCIFFFKLNLSKKKKIVEIEIAETLVSFVVDLVHQNLFIYINKNKTETQHMKRNSTIWDRSRTE